MDLLPLVVIETESGAEVRVRDSEEPGEAYESRRAALDALLDEAEFKPKAGILRDESDTPNGAWRWLDATAEEPEPYEDDFQITRDVIADAAALLNRSHPAPLDGGTNPAHAQLDNTSTHADGYAHVGVEVRDQAGRWHLYLRCEIDPVVVRDLDSGRLAFGSVAIHKRTHRLLQHALTNVPAVDGLNANNATRTVAVRSMRFTMSDAPKIPAAKRAPAPNAAQRGPAADILAKIAAALGVDVTAETEADRWESPIMDAIGILKDEAKKEKILGAAAGAGETPPPTEVPPAVSASDAMKRDVPPPAAPTPDAPRAEGAFPDAAAMELFASEALAILREVFGKPDEAPAAVLELAKASKAAFQGAIGQAAPPADAGAMSAAPAPDAAKSAATADAAKRAADENAKLRAEIAKRDLRDAIVKRATEAKASLATVELELLVDDALATADKDARERAIVRGLKAAQSVPTSDVFGKGGGSAAHADFRAAWRSLLPEIAAANPKRPDHIHVAMAQSAARERFPHLADA